MVLRLQLRLKPAIYRPCNNLLSYRGLKDRSVLRLDVKIYHIFLLVHKDISSIQIALDHFNSSKCKILKLKAALSHGHGTLARLVTTNEATCVRKDSTFGDLALTILLSLRSHDTIKVLVADTAPRLRQRLTGLEAALVNRHTLDAPLGISIGVLGVENVVDLGGGVDLLASGGLGFEVVKVLLPGDTTLGQDHNTA